MCIAAIHLLRADLLCIPYHPSTCLLSASSGWFVGGMAAAAEVHTKRVKRAPTEITLINKTEREKCKPNSFGLRFVCVCSPSEASPSGGDSGVSFSFY